MPGFAQDDRRVHMSYLDKTALRVVGTRPIRPDGVDKARAMPISVPICARSGVMSGKSARVMTALTPGNARAFSVLIDIIQA